MNLAAKIDVIPHNVIELISRANALGDRAAAAAKTGQVQEVEKNMTGLEALLSDSALKQIWNTRLAGDITKLITGLLLQAYAQRKEAEVQEAVVQNNAAASTQPVLKDRRAAELERLKMWSAKELEWLRDIDPNKRYKIALFDEKGNLTGKFADEDALGADIIHDAGLLKGFANKDKLPAKDKADLNQELFGNAQGPQDVKGLQQGTGKLKGSLQRFAGHAAAQTDDPNRHKEIEQEVKKGMEAVDGYKKAVTKNLEQQEYEKNITKMKDVLTLPNDPNMSNAVKQFKQDNKAKLEEEREAAALKMASSIDSLFDAITGPPAATKQAAPDKYKVESVGNAQSSVPIISAKLPPTATSSLMR